MKWKSLFLSIIAIFFLFLSCSDNSITNSDNDLDPDNDGDPTFNYNHQDGPGESAVDFLTNQDFENLVIEIDFMEGYEPTEDAINSLQTFLENKLNKKSVAILTPSSISAGGQAAYSTSEVRTLEETHRSEFSEENTLAAYILILDGEYEQSNVLGIAHYNTSTALFGESIHNASTGVSSNPRDIIEATVLRHEFGHLLGLVNNGVDMQQDHEDQQHKKHCTNENCLMYYSVRTTDFFSVLLGGDIPELDDQCLTDLAAAGGK